MRKTCPPTCSFETARSRSTRRRWAFIPARDRLCLVQLSDGRGDEHLVRFSQGKPIFRAEPEGAARPIPNRLKLYHFARFDVAMIQAYLGFMAAPLYCTRTASRLVRTYTDRHGLKDLVQRAARPGDFQAATDQRLGRAGTQRRAARICGERRPLPPCVEGEARRAAGARGQGRACPGLLRFPSPPRPARPRRLARARHFRTRRLRLT